MENLDKKNIVSILFLIIVISISLIGLGDSLTPLVFSLAFSYLVFPLVKKLEKRGINRNLSVLFVFSTASIIFISLLILLFPIIISDLKEFLQDFPKSFQLLLNKIFMLLSQLGIESPVNQDNFFTYIKDHTSQFSSGILKSLGKGLKMSFSGIGSGVIHIVNFFLFPVFFFYIITDYEKISTSISSFIPNSFRDPLENLLSLTNNVLSGYIRGQFLVAICLGALYSFGLSVIGLKFGFLIGLIAGAVSVIPYAGFAIGLGLSIIMGLAHFTGPNVFIGIIIVFSIVQTLEGFLITPKLVGNKVGLSSLATMLALIIGGNLLGLLGMLLAIPTAAIIKHLLTEMKADITSC